jgi:hypothetical protein
MNIPPIRLPTPIENEIYEKIATEKWADSLQNPGNDCALFPTYVQSKYFKE